MINTQCFSIQEIPSGNQQKFKPRSKIWRILGKNANSAVMCSIIHFCLSTDPKLLQLIMSQVKPKTQNAITFQKIVLSSIQTQKNPLQNLFESLRRQDSQNLLAGQFLEQYLKQKGIQYTNQDNFLEKVALEFGIQFQAYNQLGNAKLYGKEEKNQIVLYDSGSCWYHIIIEEPRLGSSSIKEQNQQKHCQYCQRPSANYHIPQCKHQICMDCLHKNFQNKQVTRFKCPVSSCKQWIDRGDYLEMALQQQKQKSPQTAVQQPQSIVVQKQENEMLCEKCFNYSGTDDLYLHSKCQKFLCKACLSRYSNKDYLNKPENIKCFSCHRQLDLKDLKIFLNISAKQESPTKEESICQNCNKITVQQDLFENPSCKHKLCRQCLKQNRGINLQNFLCLKKYCSAQLHRSSIEKFLQESNSPLKQNNYFTKTSNQVYCSKCRQYFKKEDVYNNYCGHSYCQSCADQEIVKGKKYFICYSSSCSEQIIVEDVQQYFQNQLQDKNKRSCNLCYESYLPSSMFKNYKCDHYLCYNCVNKIAQKLSYHVTCPVKMCYAYINADELDTYFTEKQEEMLKEQLKQEEEDLKLKQLEEQKQFQLQEQHPQSTQLESQNETMLNEEEMVRMAIESSLQNPIQKQQESKIEKLENVQDNKQSQISKTEEKQMKLIENPQQENMEIEENNESQINKVLQQNIEGNCTLCRFPFSDFNLPQQLGCNKHRIGVCCLRYGIQCPQCAYSEIKQKELSKPKKKFTIFQEESYYPYSSQYVSRDAEDAKPVSRLSSRIYAQPLQQNSILYQSQGLYKSTQAMRNASVGYNFNGLSRRF